MGVQEQNKVDDEQASLFVREAANVSEWPVAVTDCETDASVFLSSAAEMMLQELKKMPDESDSLTNVFLKLNHNSAVHRHCSVSSHNALPEVIEDDSCISKIRLCSAHEQKPRLGHLGGARARIAELEKNSRDIVSMFIPPDAPKLSLLNKSVGMSYES